LILGLLPNELVISLFVVVATALFLQFVSSGEIAEISNLE